ncbi:phytanoyl-CoA dioxygenase family protein [Desertivirga brevis]|uniref:phytanoyl-CoA dioxygenase family protein n=1 Tax=Desertivirga brevis TaxID=2810310 RepID=UPI001A95DA81|nr:phytanoyl-CoA dioxygenase family protein [Pedobacter sp. SYSU D00873]
MKDFQLSLKQLQEEGFTLLDNIYSPADVEGILEAIDRVDTSRPTFRKTSDLFAIRQFLKECPGLKDLIFNYKLRSMIQALFGNGFFVVKSIYFDKPEQSNWFVAYHQDLTISVDKRVEMEGFGPWTVKHQQFAVQPPVEVLNSIFTVRIHLDDTDENNGALKVVPGSHSKGIFRPETIDWSVEREKICAVKKGGVMIMKPLLLHASNRTTNNRKRRVIHIELSNIELPDKLLWAERDFENEINNP